MKTAHHLNPAASIIEMLGGLSAVAKAANTSTTSVQRWRRPKSVGGCDGYIPRRHHKALAKKAKTLGVSLPPAAFIDPAHLPEALA